MATAGGTAVAMEDLMAADPYAILQVTRLGDMLANVIKMLRAHDDSIGSLREAHASIASSVAERVAGVRDELLAREEAAKREELARWEELATRDEEERLREEERRREWEAAILGHVRAAEDRAVSVEVAMREQIAKQWRRLRPLHGVLGGSSALLRRYFVALSAHRSARVSARRRRRKLQALHCIQSTTLQGLRRVYLRRWGQWTGVLRRRARLQRQSLAAFAGAGALFVRRVYLRKAVRWTARRTSRAAALLAVSGSSSHAVRRTCMSRLLRWLSLRRVRRRRLRVAGIAARTGGDTVLRRVYHGKALEWLSIKGRQKRRAALAAALSTQTNGGLIKLRYKMWAAAAARAASRWRRARTLHAVAAASDEGLRRVYLRKAAGWARQRHRQELTLTALSSVTAAAILRRYYAKLGNSSSRARKQRAKRKLVRELEFRLGKELTRRCFNKLRLCIGRAPAPGSFSELADRCDTLGNQVEVSLKTLSNTNSVLSRVVDRLLEVDDQLEHLEREKADRQAGELVSPSHASPATARPQDSAARWDDVSRQSTAPTQPPQPHRSSATLSVAESTTPAARRPKEEPHAEDWPPVPAPYAKPPDAAAETLPISARVSVAAGGGLAPPPPPPSASTRHISPSRTRGREDPLTAPPRVVPAPAPPETRPETVAPPRIGEYRVTARGVDDKEAEQLRRLRQERDRLHEIQSWSGKWQITSSNTPRASSLPAGAPTRATAAGSPAPVWPTPSPNWRIT
eukprot:TRINITY_DN991_c0_g1_i1.p1 TRINITY_DN991_c0_g1~~TRINITY_DN991_c0_g1_i1.p1  ORF type:complete len:766 (+),score=257.78 TRINITY_DN991_c0_g1_i1:62-2299(+)